jgi:hypothetical protein
MRFNFYSFLCLLIFVSFPALSQNDSVDFDYAVADTLRENTELFNSDELLSITLRFNITEYRRKKSDKEYLDAILTYYTSDQDSTNKEIKVKSRGEFRRLYCDLPPLLLNFKMKDTTEGEFFKINKLKMVTQCKPADEEYLLKEYLIYKLYNVITENSYRVRLLKVNYINTFKKSKPVSQFAFVIEPNNIIAKRLNAVEVNTTNVSQRNIRPEVMDRMAIFNYMVGNPDWSVRIQHNVLIVTQPASERPDLGIVIPFDFDFSGLVNTNYAMPYVGMRIKSVRERVYLGMCRDEQVFTKELGEFLNKKEEFYKVISEFPYLKENTKKEMISYLDEFYRDFDQWNTITKKVLSGCLNL